MMISLNDRQLDIVVTAAGALDPKKRDGGKADIRSLHGDR
jgi:hypothetical protein